MAEMNYQILEQDLTQPAMKVLVIFDKGDSRLRCMVDPAVLLYRNWLTALLEDVSQPKASQCCTGLWIQTKPLAKIHLLSR